MPSVTSQHFLFLGGDHHGEFGSDNHDKRLDGGYLIKDHMIPSGDSKYQHYRAAFHNSYDLDNTESDINKFGLQSYS